MKKRLLSIVLALAMCLSLLPTMALAATAPASIHVGGVELTASAPYVLNGESYPIAALPQDITTGYAHYDAISGVLTLSDFSYEGAGHEYQYGDAGEYTDHTAIYCAGDLTVVLKGAENSLKCSESSENGNGIVTTGNLTIQGEGALTIGTAGTDNESNSDCYTGLSSDGNIEITSGDVAIYSTGTSIWATNMTISGGELTIDSDYVGIWLGGNIAISGETTSVTITSVDNAAISADNNITVESSTLDLNGSDGLSANNTVEIRGGSVTIEASNTGILGGNGVTIEGETTKVDISMTDGDSSYGIYTHENDVTISSGEVSIDGADCGIYIYSYYSIPDSGDHPRYEGPGNVNLNGGTITITNASQYAISVDCREEILRDGHENGAVKLEPGMKIVEPVNAKIGDTIDTSDPSKIDKGANWHNTIFDGAGAPAKSITIEENTYTIKFNANGGNGTMEDKEVEAGAYRLPDNGFTPPTTEKTFGGWNTAANGSGTAVAAGGTYTVNADTTFYAVWEPVTPPPHHYKVTYDGNGNTSGTVPTDGNSYALNAQVTVLGNGTLEKREHTFGGWSLNADGSTPLYGPNHNQTYTITADTTFYAVWNAAPVIDNSDDDDSEPTYRITVEETDNGEVKSNRKWAEGGETVRLTITPEQGYDLVSLTVTDRRGDEIELTDKGEGVYTFRMPHRDVTVTASFGSDWNLGYRDCPRDESCPYWPYTDTDTRAWYHDGVHFCIENGLMVGYGNNIFKPDNSTTRAMITVMLWRLEGSPVVDFLLDFEDVPAEAWYTEAVRWAKSEGVAEGYGNGFFGPNDDVTREQMVTILWRYAQYMGYDVSVGEDTNILSYEDALTVSEYAIPAMQWACGSGMIVGKETEDGGMILDPKGTTTRAQMATMMMRFCAEIVK